MDMKVFNWTELERLPIVSLDINPITYLPQHFSLDNEIIIGRTELSSIPKSAWSTLNDPKIRGGEAKQRLVSSYNMACIYYLKRMCEESIAANTSKSKTISVTHRSMTRQSTSEEYRIKLSIEGGGGSGDGSNSTDFWSLKGVLENEYGINKVTEYIQEDTKAVTEEYKIESTYEDRTIVYWDFIKVIAIYRTGKASGKVELTSVDDYLISSFSKTYLNK